jgi:CheY-like chemotaxis protein
MGGGLSGVTVLVVEDDPDLLELLRQWLSGFGATVREARNGFQALDQVRLAPPDVILCDLHMPGLDGCAFIQRVKTELGLAHIPVIAVTGRAEREDLMRTMEAGFAGHLVKPVTPEAIRAQIDRALGR